MYNAINEKFCKTTNLLSKFHHTHHRLRPNRCETSNIKENHTPQSFAQLENASNTRCVCPPIQCNTRIVKIVACLLPTHRHASLNTRIDYT